MINKELAREIKKAELNIYGSLLESVSVEEMSKLMKMSMDEARRIGAKVAAMKTGLWNWKSSDIVDENENEFSHICYKNRYKSVINVLQGLIVDLSWYERVNVAFGFVINNNTKEVNRCSYLIDKYNYEVIDVNPVIFESETIGNYSKELTYVSYAIMNKEKYLDLVMA